MQSYSATDIIKTLKANNICFFTLADFAKLFNLENSQTLYKKIARLEKKQIIQKLVKGKYRFLLAQCPDFELAGFLYPPSYISLESALSFHSLITSFPYQITSMTTRTTKTIGVNDQEFRYSRLAPSLFWGYEKKENFLLAEPEKALLDYIYLGTKGLRRLSFDEMDFSSLEPAKLADYTDKFSNRQIKKIVGQIL